MTRIALTGGTVYVTPFSKPLSDAIVLIDDSRIAYSGAREGVSIGDAQELDCSGCTVTAGLRNSHVHFFTKPWADAADISRERLQQLLDGTFNRFGFTTVFDLGSPWKNTSAIRDRIDSGEVRGPRILSTGEALLPQNAMPPPEVLEQYGFIAFPAPEISNAAQAAQAADDLLQAGADGIKIFPSSPRSDVMPEDAIAAAARAAYERGKPVFAHCDTVDDVRAAIRNGVTVVAHTTPQSPEWDSQLIAEMKNRNIAVTPTLALWKSRNRLQSAIGQLRAWHAAGGSVLFGTDLGAVGPDPETECELMLQAGMSFAEILNSLTVAPARRFGHGDLPGTLQAGAPADVAVFSGTLSEARYVLRNGLRVV